MSTDKALEQEVKRSGEHYTSFDIYPKHHNPLVSSPRMEMYSHYINGMYAGIAAMKEVAGRTAGVEKLTEIGWSGEDAPTYEELIAQLIVLKRRILQLETETWVVYNHFIKKSQGEVSPNFYCLHGSEYDNHCVKQCEQCYKLYQKVTEGQGESKGQITSEWLQRNGWKKDGDFFTKGELIISKCFVGKDMWLVTKGKSVAAGVYVDCQYALTTYTEWPGI